MNLWRIWGLARFSAYAADVRAVLSGMYFERIGGELDARPSSIGADLFDHATEHAMRGLFQSALRWRFARSSNVAIPPEQSACDGPSACTP